MASAYLERHDAVLVKNEIPLFKLKLGNLGLFEERTLNLLVRIISLSLGEVKLLKDEGVVLAVFLLLKDRGIKMLPLVLSLHYISIYI